MKYDFKSVESKWQRIWDTIYMPLQRAQHYHGKKFYCLDMFPYPSGSGLHVGHWRGYVFSDVYTRMKWLQGYNVLHPMGWDAFGLPAENDAIKKGVHPRGSVHANIAMFKRQLKRMGALYDWDKELNTTDPEYYKWTQWIFLQLYHAGLAYRTDMPINWCPSCLTGLANEEVVQEACERCGTTVIQKSIPQWVLKITAYAEKLLHGLERLEWPAKVKAMQRNWIGRSEGAYVDFVVKGFDGASHTVTVFTTLPETIYGVSFIAVAADHAILKKAAVTPQPCGEGYDTGLRATHPFTHASIPLYVALFVLLDYGTGAIMGVPAHDERDKAFAIFHNLPVISVIAGEGTAQERLIASGTFTGMSVLEGRKAVIAALQAMGAGRSAITYKIRDWIFSRQRYWGEPIPLVHCPSCGIVPLKESDLPLLLPEVDRYQPTGTGESPLAAIAEWVNTTCPSCGSAAKRETNTMPQWAGSCWYFLRYPNPHLTNKPFDQADLAYWLPVDFYVGGIEHAILHLLYARFWTKVLHDRGIVSFDEPFLHLFNQGMILKYSEKTGQVEKMSKSKGNVVNPDDIVETYGADVLRMYILFIGPAELDCEWQDSGLEGIRRFSQRFYGYMSDPECWVDEHATELPEVTRAVHRLFADCESRLMHYKPNTAIARCMEFVNQALEQRMRLSAASREGILALFSLFAPHMASELLAVTLGKSLTEVAWPSYKADYLQDLFVTIVVQVNGKMRTTVQVPVDAGETITTEEARRAVEQFLGNKAVARVVWVPGRLVNFVLA